LREVAVARVLDVALIRPFGDVVVPDIDDRREGFASVADDEYLLDIGLNFSFVSTLIGAIGVPSASSSTSSIRSNTLTWPSSVSAPKSSV